MTPAITRRLLAALLLFGAVSAVGGGILGVAFGGAGVPLEYLEGTPFTSFVWPGLILGVVIGGTQSVAAIAVLRRHPLAMAAASVAGFGMILWIFAELAILAEYSPLQTVYVALGIIELLLVLRLAGVFTLTPRPRPAAPHGGVQHTEPERSTS
ncbi:hypothetical protein ACEXQD_04280 [Herbiconiux sp. P15]|uniref:hypothetical protein n=1 Tax=Herbiconiux liukaitaii TaxID=3342799 RepID=UPI0035BA64FA